MTPLLAELAAIRMAAGEVASRSLVRVFFETDSLVAASCISDSTSSLPSTPGDMIEAIRGMATPINPS